LLTKANHGQISLTKILRLLAEHPAKIFGLKRKGRLAVGMDGDVVLIDPKERFRIDSSTFYSKAHFSPFDGARCVGRPVTTIVLGHVVYDHGEIIDRNRGKITTREVRARDSSSTAC
jgi:dihydroorotase